MTSLRLIAFGLFSTLLCLSGFAQKRKANILDHKDRIRVKRMDVLNSASRETNLSITPDGKYLFFMSLRGGQPWSQSYTVYKGQAVYDGDIWFSKKSGSSWQSPKCLDASVNTSSGEDEPNVSPDGKSVIFQSWKSFWYLSGGPYYESTLRGNRWGTPKGLGGGITSFFMAENVLATDGMTISAGGNTFVVACGRDYDGNMDLYLSRKTIRGWSYCQKLPVSTSGDERSVFLAADGKTLYFASDGYNGFGGLDIYKTTINNDGTLGEVINIGEPFNTPNDDYGFILTGDGNEAYFVRDGDIYYADLKEADEQIKPQVTVILAGTVRDSISNQALNSEIKVIDVKSGKTIARLRTDDIDGEFSTVIPNESKVYRLEIKNRKYPEKEKFVSVQKSDKYNAFQLEIFLYNPPPKPEPEEEPIASNEVPDPPETPETPEPEPEEKPVFEEVLPDEKPEPEPEPQVQVEPEEEEDPYSFEGVAENNMILLLDVSASMNKTDKLPLLKKSVKKLLEFMRPEDQISVIVYSGDATVVLSPTSAVYKNKIVEAIQSLSTQGATDSKQGLKKAYEVAEDYFIRGGNNRIILATDGSFDIEGLYRTVEKNARPGVFLSVFAFGKQFENKEEAMKQLAEKGGGNYANVNSDNVDKVLLKEAKAVRK